MRSAQISGHPDATQAPVEGYLEGNGGHLAIHFGLVQGVVHLTYKGCTSHLQNEVQNRGGYIVPAAHPLVTNGTTNWLSGEWRCPELECRDIG